MQDKAYQVDVLTIRDYLDAATCDDIVAELKRASGGPATVYGKEKAGVVEPHVRKVTRVVISPATRGRLLLQLLARKGELEAHFGISLSECEEPQFLRYQEGDYFVAHQDGNTPLIYDQSRHRRVSVVIFLSAQAPEPAPDTYGGGELVFHGPYQAPDFRLPIVGAPGTLVAFRSETTHEVVPVTHGERYTIVSWFR